MVAGKAFDKYKNIEKGLFFFFNLCIEENRIIKKRQKPNLNIVKRLGTIKRKKSPNGKKKR